MIYVPKRYRHFDDNSIEITTRIVAFLTFEDISNLIDEWECTKDLYIPDATYNESLASGVCGYKVELVDSKLQNVGDDDILALSRMFSWAMDDCFGKNVSISAAEDYLKKDNIYQSNLLKKLEFRVVVPHRFMHIEANIRAFFEKKPISLIKYEDDPIIVPELVNVGEYGKKVDTESHTEKEVMSALLRASLDSRIQEQELNKKEKLRRKTRTVKKNPTSKTLIKKIPTDTLTDLLVDICKNEFISPELLYMKSDYDYSMEELRVHWGNYIQRNHSRLETSDERAVRELIYFTRLFLSKLKKTEWLPEGKIGVCQLVIEDYTSFLDVPIEDRTLWEEVLKARDEVLTCRDSI